MSIRLRRVTTTGLCISFVIISCWSLFDVSEAASIGDTRERAFDIGSNKVCTVNGKNGTCMFTSKCKERKGYVLGTCRHNFIFGACCADEAVEGASDLSSNSSATSEILISLEKLLSKHKPSLILPDGTLHNLKEDTKNSPQKPQVASTTVTNTSASPRPTIKIQLEQTQIESMINSMIDSVIEKFDPKLPSLLDNLTTVPAQPEEDSEVTTPPTSNSTSVAVKNVAISDE